jgi:Xaa-Pro aminopeptidase
MTEPAAQHRDQIEKVGGHFAVAGMLAVRDLTRQAVEEIAQRIEPGMTEEEGVSVAKRTLKDLGLLRGWHRTFVRFGRNTVKEYGNPSEPGIVLGANDIFFVDIGPLLGNHEGDGGATYVVGSDEEMLRARRDVVVLWDRVHEAWRFERWTGRALYQFAEAEASAMGWDLNLKRMSGHRIGDFPHKHRFEGLLSDVDIVPSPHVWVLEMHIRHPSRPFGAFYEDLMLA